MTRRRKLLSGIATVSVVPIAGCSSSELGSEDETESSGEESETGSEGDSESEDGSGDDAETQLIPTDPITDLFPDVDEFPNSGWEVRNIDLDIDSRLRIDAEGYYTRELDEGGQIAQILITGYDNIEDAESRYESSLSLAESSNDFQREIGDGVDDGYIGSVGSSQMSGEVSGRYWRDRNVFFQVQTGLNTPEEDVTPLPDLAEQLQTVVQDNWQEQLSN